MSKELIVRKDGTSAIENADGIGINQAAVEHIVEQHVVLRRDGFHTAEISSGAVATGRMVVTLAGFDPKGFDITTLAMIGMPSHFNAFQTAANPHRLVVANSLSTEIELRDTKEGKQIRSGMGRTVQDDRILLVGNYHDEADPAEIRRFKKDERARRKWRRRQKRVANGTLLTNEDSENDGHAANVAIAVGASILILCTEADGFYKHGKKLETIDAAKVESLLPYCYESTKSGTGGMATKLQAGKKAAEAGIHVVIGSFKEDSRRLIEGQAGTRVVQ